MRKYYVVETYQRKGPYNLDELRAYGITQDTMIWCFEFDEPKPAGTIPELASLFTSPEPPQENKPENMQDIDSENVSGTPFNIDETPPPPPPPTNEVDKNVPPVTPENKPETPPPPPDNEQLNPPPPPIPKDEQQNVPPPPPVSEQKEQQQQNIIPPPPIGKKKEEKEQEVINSQDNQHKQLKTYNVSSSTTTAPMPNTYLALSIITTLFCCLILGIISIVFSSQVKKKYEEGDYEGALSASKTALILNIVSIIAGIVAFSIAIFMEN